MVSYLSRLRGKGEGCGVERVSGGERKREVINIFHEFFEVSASFHADFFLLFWCPFRRFREKSISMTSIRIKSYLLGHFQDLYVEFLGQKNLKTHFLIEPGYTQKKTQILWFVVI